MKSFVCLLMSLVCLVFGGSATAAQTRMVTGATSMIVPDFLGTPTIVNVQSGLWSDPASWDLNRVPKAGDRVAINGNSVVYDVVSDEAIDTIAIDQGGKLSFKSDVNTKLTVGNLLVMMEGTLEIGTPNAPISPLVKAEVVIVDKPLDFTNDNVGAYDPDQLGTGVLGMGRVTVHGSELSKTFLRLASEPKVGNTTLTLSEPVSGWKVGDRLILPDSKFGSTQWETPVISAINGNVVTLENALAFNHDGGRDASNNLIFLPYVGNLSRNVIFRSANPAGVRGQVMMMVRATVDIQYASFKDLGRTLNSKAVDQTVRDTAGNVVSVGTNQLGRYPLHMHFLCGPVTTPANGYQFNLIGNVVDGGDAPNDHKWGIVVHQSHFGLIQGNITYNTTGAGFTAEDGPETGNLFDGNFAVRSEGLGGTNYDRISQGNPHDFGHAGDGFWLTGPGNIVKNNVVANASESGFNIYESEFLAQSYRIPLFKGADVGVAGQYQTVANGQLPFASFSDNEAYGINHSGCNLRLLGLPSSTPQALLSNMRVWNSQVGFNADSVSPNATLQGFYVLGDPTKTGTYGFLMNIIGVGMNVVNAIVQNVDVGLYAPNHTTTFYRQAVDWAIIAGTPYSIDGVFNVNGVSFRNNKVDVRVDNKNPSANSTYDNRKVVLSNVSFSHNTVPGYVAIDTDLKTNLTGTDLRKRQEIYVYNFDQVEGDNFQVFFASQAPNVIMPKSSSATIGSPVANLNNQQNWDAYGIAIGGLVLPANATNRPQINGLVAPIGTIPQGDVKAPLISGLSTSQTPDGKITVNWQTDEPADSRVYYGNPSYMASAGDDPNLFKTSHSVVLPTNYGVTYKIVVVARDYADNITSTGFYAGDTLPPTLSRFVSTVLSPTSMRLTWTTNEPADSLVEYNNLSVYDPALVTSHTVNLTGLSASTVYNYKITSKDQAGNPGVSTTLSFRIQPPVISNLTTTILSQTSTKITWTTDTPANTRVAYGTTTDYGKNFADENLVTNHVAVLTGLTYLTPYQWIVGSKDVSGSNTLSTNQVFFAGAIPKFLSITNTGYSEVGTWALNSYYGFKTHNALDPVKGTATWNFGTVPAGKYRVYATWYADINRATQAPFTIFDEMGNLATVVVNQQVWPTAIKVSGKNYNLLGEYDFRGGVSGVFLKDGEVIPGASRLVVADTIMLVPITP